MAKMIEKGRPRRIRNQTLPKKLARKAKKEQKKEQKQIAKKEKKKAKKIDKKLRKQARKNKDQFGRKNTKASNATVNLTCLTTAIQLLKFQKDNVNNFLSRQTRQLKQNALTTKKQGGKGFKKWKEK